MPDTDNTPILIAKEGFKASDVTAFVQYVPAQATAGIDVIKEPQTGAFVALTRYPHFNKLGYLTALKKGTSTKFRILLTDHPDGG